MSVQDAVDWWPLTAKRSTLADGAAVAESWKGFGFSLEEAAKWQGEKFSNVPDRDRPALARDFAAQSMTPRSAAEWFGRGFEPQEAAKWKQAGIGRATEAAKQRDAGVRPDGLSNIESYVDAGLTLRQALKWAAAPDKEAFSPSKAREWQQAGIDEPAVALIWQRAGISAAQASKYEKARKLRNAA